MSAWNFLDLNDSNATAMASETTAVAFTTIRNKVLTVLVLLANQKKILSDLHDVRCPAKTSIMLLQL